MTNGQALKGDILHTRRGSAIAGAIGPAPLRLVLPDPVRRKIMLTCHALRNDLLARSRIKVRTDRFAIASDIELMWPYDDRATIRSLELTIVRAPIDFGKKTIQAAYDYCTLRIGYTPTALVAVMPDLEELVVHVEAPRVASLDNLTTSAAVGRFCSEIQLAHLKFSDVAVTQAGPGQGMTFTFSK